MVYMVYAAHLTPHASRPKRILTGAAKVCGARSGWIYENERSHGSHDARYGIFLHSKLFSPSNVSERG